MVSIAFSTDVHNETSIFPWIKKNSETHDLVMIGGDLGALVSHTILGLSDHFTNVVVVLGNHDSPDPVYHEFHARLLHGSTIEIDGLTIGGLSGSLPVAGWPFEVSDSEYEVILNKLGHVDILLSHQPPHGAGDLTYDGVKVGSFAVRDYIMKEHPLLCLTGHIHEGSGAFTIGKTTVVNPGPFMVGNYAEIMIKDGEVLTELVGKQLGNRDWKV